MTFLDNLDDNLGSVRAPEHLLSYSWLELEKRQALSVLTDLETMVKRLDKKLSPKRVHQSRVVLRRWYSVWDILAIDGWEDSGYPEGGFEKSVGADLRRLNKQLGKLRDLDVSRQLAEELDLNFVLQKRLKKKRRALGDIVEGKISALKPGKLVVRLRSYLADRSEQLHYALERNNLDSVLITSDLSAYYHLDQFLLQAEHQSKLLSEHSQNNEELHELRLSIKRWRYLLTEFFGLTNLELVKAQQILGRIRDLRRLKDEMAQIKAPLRKALVRRKLNTKVVGEDRRRINKLIEEQFVLLDPLLERLPYGLRPYLFSCQHERNNTKEADKQIYA
jgi:CHAD domain-containing protein